MKTPNLEQLREPFPDDAVEWRIQRAGRGRRSETIYARVLAYITARAIQCRLDEVCGPGGWQNRFEMGPAGGVLCGIAIRVGDEWITKWDGAETSDIEPVKGALSGAFKRAAVLWGIGRYLYGLGEQWAEVHERGRFRATTKEGEPFRWDPPARPPWALPAPERSAATEPSRRVA
jgi:hypothetical protein